MIKRLCYIVVGIGAIIYGVAVLLYVASVPDLGLHSAFGTTIKGNSPGVVEHEGLHPFAGDKVTRIGHLPIGNWRDIMQAPKLLREAIDAATVEEWFKWDGGGQPLVRVSLQRSADAQPYTAWYRLGTPNFEQRFPAILWFFLKGLLFLVGVLVFWKRPNDDAAAQFYLLCVVTLGAYMGGYHWSQIAPEPALILVFMVCAVLLPAVSLHFYLLFPRRKQWLAQYPGRALLGIYSLPGVALIALVGVYSYVKWFADGAEIVRGIDLLRDIIFVTFGISALWYLGCIAALLHSFWTAQAVMEQNQVKCILGGLSFAVLPLGYSLYLVLWLPDRFADGAATWPMFLASACVSVAFAVSISRYRLMEIDKIISSSMAYFLISCLAGLTYYGVLFLGSLLFYQIASPDLASALTASTTALVLLLALDMARSRFKKALDRRFSRNKSQLDRTLQQMGQAVAQLVDPPVLAQKLLQSTTELLGIRSGAIYLRQADPPVFRLSAFVGHPPALDELGPGFPLVEAVQTGAILLPPERSGLQPPSLAQRQLQFLGGEVTQPLTHNGRLLALMVLGPKDTPYRADDCHLLASFAQITVLALESAAGHRTIEQLNRELQAKVDKIAEQQRRILVLQTQLHRQNAPEPAPEPVAAPAAPARTLSATIESAGGIIGSSPVVRQLHGLIRKVAATDAVVLIRGESGTGKELLARGVHDTSARAGKPYVKVHCAALSANLLESELFGHVKGAYTGAHRDKVGRFELANGGTLFLDEIGDISIEVQTKLLRVLQEKTFERVGSSDPVQVDVRIIAATHQHLEGLIRQGRFREDLFYRLNVFPIVVPPLRARAEDIPELVVHFMRQSAQRCRKEVQAIDDEALAALKAFSWPGNIRQLENAIERAVVIAEAPVLTLQELAEDVLECEPPLAHVELPARVVAAAFAPNGNGHGNGINLKSERERFERDQLVRALSSAAGNKSEAARSLGIARSTLVSRLKKLGLS
jgi:transcriptional regulator with GAF, ATPase, and Fis domain